MRKGWWPGVFAILLGIGLSITCSFHAFGPGATKRLYFRIDRGMSLNDVRAILGPPQDSVPGSYDDCARVLVWNRKEWGRISQIVVEFDDDCCVARKSYVSGKKTNAAYVVVEEHAE